MYIYKFIYFNGILLMFYFKTKPILAFMLLFKPKSKSICIGDI